MIININLKSSKSGKYGLLISPLVLMIVFLFGAASPVYAEQSMAASKKGALEIVVYKSPTCGCCDDWVTHLEKEGFNVAAHNRNNMDHVKNRLGVMPHLASCHTATIDGYVIEGHVPAADIKKLLKERPDIVGLTAPGMPMHSPGMQPHDKKPSGYDVLMFDQEGGRKLFTRY